MTDDLLPRLQEYGAALDESILATTASRSIVPLDSYPTPPRRASARRTLVLLAVTIVTIGAVTLVARHPSKGEVSAAAETSIPIRSVPTNVSARLVEGHPVFIVRSGNDWTVFSADVRHLPSEPLWWCPQERIFVGPFHGEQFDAQGRKIGGPSRGGLNRYSATVRGSRLVIDLSTVIAGGSSSDGVAAIQNSGTSATDRAWDSGPGSFCDGAIRSTRSAHQQ